jgi:hypothetical protein
MLLAGRRTGSYTQLQLALIQPPYPNARVNAPVEGYFRGKMSHFEAIDEAITLS